MGGRTTVVRIDAIDALKAMAYGHKSPGLVNIKSEIDGQEISVKARLSLQEQPDGSIKIQTHPKQDQPDFENQFMGVKFNEKDIEQLKQTGNGGRVFDLEPMQPFYGRELSRALAINRTKTYRKNSCLTRAKSHRLDPDPAYNFTPFCCRNFWDHLPPFLRGQFNRFFHEVSKNQ